jgi:uncharacterized delta-60 repeat protein
MAALALLVLPTAAQARGGALDPSFGGSGRLVISASNEGQAIQPVASAAGPGGTVVAATKRRVYVIGKNGKLKSSFGANGSVRIAPVAGTTFSLASVAADSQGRVLVAGTGTSIFGNSPGPKEFPGPVPASATVYRLLPDGSLDPSFGSGGVTTSTFGQLPPTDLGGQSYSVPAVAVSAMAVDAADRPVLSGMSVSRVTVCNYFTQQLFYTERTFTARLTAEGKEDPSFGVNGVVDANQEDFDEGLAMRPNGDIVVARSTESPCPRFAEGKPPALTVLQESGALRSSFLTKGTSATAFLRTVGLATDPGGRILSLESQVNGEGAGFERLILRRYRADGTLDSSFGKGGSVSPKLPHTETASGASDLAVDAKGRPLIAAVAPGKANGSGFLLMRLTSAGKVDHGFAHNGVARTSFGGSSRTVDPQISIDSRGRIVLGSGLLDKRLNSGYGLAFARFLGGS